MNRKCAPVGENNATGATTTIVNWQLDLGFYYLFNIYSETLI